MLELTDYMDDNEQEYTEDAILTSTNSLALGHPEQLSDEEQKQQQTIIPRRAGLRPRRTSIYITSKRPLQTISGIDFSSMNDRPTKKPKPVCLELLGKRYLLPARAL